MNLRNEDTSFRSESVIRHLFVVRNFSIDTDHAIKDIENRHGVDFVKLEFCNKSSRLTVGYDALHLSIDDILDVLQENHILLIGNRLKRWTIGWYRFVDDNIKCNAAREPWKCH
ncbi:MAG: hypothetical protein ACI9DO_000972 [Reinekea sp.]|jgi:hypothetical protein